MFSLREWCKALANGDQRLVQGEKVPPNDRASNAETTVDSALALLREHGLQPLLVKYLPKQGYSNFDVVVGRGQLLPARRALAGWGTKITRHPLEPSKLLVHPPHGPAAHLHEAVEWFGVPLIPTEHLLPRAVTDNGRLVPDSADQLRILVGHGVFQNLTLAPVEVAEMRRLAGSRSTVEDARRRCAAEGWARAFDVGMTVLDRPPRSAAAVPVPTVGALVGALGHAGYLLRSGSPLAALRGAGFAFARELVRRRDQLRHVRRRHWRRRGALIVSISGPDGTGKTTLAAALADRLQGTHVGERRTCVSVRHVYGCVVCRMVSSSPRWYGSGEAAGSSLPRVLRLVHRLHSRVDAMEARARIAWSARRCDVVVTDRGPMDSLVKFYDDEAASLGALRVAAAQADLNVVLTGRPEVLAARDGEHSAAELARADAVMRLLEEDAQQVVRLDTSIRPVTDLVDDIMTALRTTRPDIVVVGG